MAAQCRSPRCTAERKGFRRELDSWRHRLIHCVGFESILEGLYGPGLRKDLSLFDDCEPEELVDWCVDDKCSLCNLRKDTVDHTPSGGSAQSTPTGELISQGQFNTEKTECQAENYLNALFQKKDLPQNCDPNIPLVAQELMKKMIRQFAIEYVSKSRKMYQESNGTIADNPLGCNGIQKNHTDSLLLDEQDGPLDLTVARDEEQTFQDGVLDLSIKRNGSAFEENSKTRNSKNGVMNGYFLRKMKKSTQLHKENTVLFKVLASWCLYHQQQLMGMLKFLKSEQEFCSQSCHSIAQSKSTEQLSRSRNTSFATCHICTNKQSTKNIKINEKTRQINLPYLTVCLKDLRFTWPNLNLGTVKLNLNKKEDVHLSDQLLHCINTRSKKMKSVCYNYLSSHCSTSQRKLPFSSSLSKLKVQRTVTDLKRTMVKHGLQCRCIQPGCRLEMSSNCCQTGDISDGNYTTVMKNVTFKEFCCASKKQSRLKPNRKDTRKNSLDSSTSSCVNFGSLLKHFLNSETNGFPKLLNQKENCSEKKVQTGFHRNNEKISLFDNSLPECQTIDFARELNNLTDPFLKEKNNFVKNVSNSKDDSITISLQECTSDVLVPKDCESTETESKVQEKIANLPHDTLKISFKNVNCIKNSQFCLPANLQRSAPQKIVNEKQRENKRHNDQDLHAESGIPAKRNSRNILGKCKLCDMSHGLCSLQDNNYLFCKCTIRKNSGILKNFKAEGVKFINTTEKNRNTHLKVIVERIKDSKLSANSTINGKDICKSKNTNLCNSNVKESSSMLNVPQKTLNNVKQSNWLNSTLVAQTNCESVDETRESVSKAVIPATSLQNSYFSPIKLMFVSKVESKDGVKYTLSSEYTPMNKHTDGKLSDSAVSQTWNPNSIQNRFSKNKALPSPQNSPAKLLYSDQSPFERKTLRCKKLAHLVSTNIERSIESEHKKHSQKTFAKAGRNIAIFPNKTESKNHSSKSGNSRIAETYIVQNKGSGTQMRIKKVKGFQRSSDRNLHMHESKSLNFQRLSKRLKLRKLSNVSGMYRTNSSVLQEEGQAVLSPLRSASTQYTEKDVSNIAEKDQNQKTIMKQKWSQDSLLTEMNLNLKCSNHNTRSRKSLSTPLNSVPSSNFSVRSALCHKLKKLHLNKCRVYRRRLRSYKHQSKVPLIDTKCTGKKIDAANHTANIDFQPNPVVKWWSLSTPKESLLKDLENKYEQIANTWLGEDNGEKDNETQSLSTLKFGSSETRSPVQMLFQKKCDIGDLAAWFMQTTETQSLTIVKKANARSPLHKINRKEPRTKPKKPSSNSCSSKKDFENCQPTSSETLTELLNVSTTNKRKCNSGQNLNNLKNVTDQNKDVCVKFACSAKCVDVTKACAEKASNNSEALAKKLDQSADIDVKSGACQGAATIPGPVMPMDSPGCSSKKQRMSVNKSKSNPKTIYMCCSTKQNIQDCKVFLTKLESDIGSEMSSAYRRSQSGNTIAGSKSKFRPEWKLRKGFTAKYCLRMNKSLDRYPRTWSRIETSASKKCNFGMCLRQSKGPGAPSSSHSKSTILERQKQLSKMTLYVKTNAKKSKPQISKIQSECPKFQLGPIKPVGVPASKGGTYSLTPIRIPLQ